jgi:hypothetical protein
MLNATFNPAPWEVDTLRINGGSPIVLLSFNWQDPAPAYTDRAGDYFPEEPGQFQFYCANNAQNYGYFSTFGPLQDNPYSGGGGEDITSAGPQYTGEAWFMAAINNGRTPYCQVWMGRAALVLFGYENRRTQIVAEVDFMDKFGNYIPMQPPILRASALFS